MTDHPLTKTTASEVTDEMVLAALNGFTGGDSPTLDRYDHLNRLSARAALRAALAVASTVDDRPWEPLNGNPVRVGYEVRQEWYGVTRTGIVGRVDGNGDPWTAEGGYIGPILGGTWYVRRPVTEAAELARIILDDSEGEPAGGIYSLTVHEARTLANATLNGDNT